MCLLFTAETVRVLKQLRKVTATTQEGTKNEYIMFLCENFISQSLIKNELRFILSPIHPLLIRIMVLMISPASSVD